MLRITIMEEHDVATIRLEGKLVGPWVEELERCWNTAMAGWRNTQLLVDLNMVTFVDASGRALLTKMHNAGAKLMGRGILTTYILEQIGHCQADQRCEPPLPITTATEAWIRCFFSLVALIGGGGLIP